MEVPQIALVILWCCSLRWEPNATTGRFKFCFLASSLVFHLKELKVETKYSKLCLLASNLLCLLLELKQNTKHSNDYLIASRVFFFGS